jgi:hypothetical protein
LRRPCAYARMDGEEIPAPSPAQEMNAVKCALPRDTAQLISRVEKACAGASLDMEATTVQSHAQALLRPASHATATAAVKSMRRSAQPGVCVPRPTWERRAPTVAPWTHTQI